MITTRLTFALAIAAFVRSGADPELHVLRTSPDAVASPAANITVTFDRPVAGSLDYTVAAESILSVSPAIAGRIEWRDPVTIRLTPSGYLSANTTYTVTVANNFKAMDGGRLASPYTFTFRVRGATALTGSPASGFNRLNENLPQDTRFEVVYSAPVDSAALSNLATVELTSACAAPRVVRLQVLKQRAITEKDDWNYRSAGGWQRERGADSMRRVVLLAPPGPFPVGCAGTLRVPEEMGSPQGTTFTSWPFAIHGALTITKSGCGDRDCPTGPAYLTFSTPVKGADVARSVKILPPVKFTLRDTAAESQIWILEARLRPRTVYAIVADTSLRDIFGQRLMGNPAVGFQTTGYEAAIKYPFGRLVVERSTYPTLAIQSINVDTLVVTTVEIPDSMEAKWLSRANWGYRDLWPDARKTGRVSVQRIPVTSAMDRGLVTNLKLPIVNQRSLNAPTLMAIKVQTPKEAAEQDAEAPVALIQVTDLAVHAKIGVAEGMVWVTGVSDGKARAGAAIVLYNDKGKPVARAVTDSAGLARLTGYKPPDTPVSYDADYEGDESSTNFEGYVAASLGMDRAVVAISEYDPDLSPWRFNLSAATGDDRKLQAGAVFTERGIYRPGETVYAKAIARVGPLGALMVPPKGDSVRWVFRDRENAIIKTRSAKLSSFGTANTTFVIPGNSALGYYGVDVERKQGKKWGSLARTNFRVAEYRPPQFLVQLSGDSTPHFPGDTVRPVVQARYLFGAPMGRAVVTWSAKQSPVWYVDIPGTEGFIFGDNGWWWEEDNERGKTNFLGSGVDTLDLSGHRALTIALPATDKGRAARVVVEAVVTDVNRQVVGATTAFTVQPASFYIGVKPLSESWFWTAGTPVKIEIIAARSNGTRVPGVSVKGIVVRREWHQVRRQRDGITETVGDWVSDTVAHCDATTAASAASCAFTPPGGGEYTVTFSATDEKGRVAETSFNRWATGSDWVPWNDESKFKMDVIPDKARYSVGDTASVMFAAPFTNAEAWVTVEREGIIEQRRFTITSGATKLKFPITEAYAPNAFVSIVVARGRSAPRGPPDDPGRPTIRVGYAELRVTPELKRLKVDAIPSKAEYRPGDTAKVAIMVRDAKGKGQRAEVTLWAVDEGVLALTDYKTPDPIDLLFAERGIGMRLASNLVAVAPQIPEGLKGGREPGGGGGAALAGVLRSRFRTTAFFLATVITDSDGAATASAKLPDNLTTFRVMAVAVTQGDRYGSGQSPMLVTRPLLARPALPRFVRAADEFAAGAVINQRAGGTPTVKVTAAAENITLTTPPDQTVTLEQGRGREVRFGFRALPGTASIPPGQGDSASFRFDVTDGTNADAVRVRVPIRPDYHPRSYTIAGVLMDTATAVFTLPAGIDPDRSRLYLSVGPSPLALVRAAYWQMEVYPYDCSEQVSSEARVLIALYQAQRALGKTIPADSIVRGDPKREIEKAVEVLSARQRSDGGIGYWSSTDWTTPWLSAYAGAVLVDAKSVGVAVDDSVMARLARYLGDAMRAPKTLNVPVSNYYGQRWTALGDQVAAADLLSRMGKPDLPTENSLLRDAAQMSFEDRLRLAEMIARRGDLKTARELMVPAWALVTVEGRKATLPDSVRTYFYFSSRMRPMARLLVATVMIDKTNRLIAPMVETLAQISGAGANGWYWSSQDLASAVSALATYERVTNGSAPRRVRVRGGTGNQVLLDVAARNGPVAVVVKPGTSPAPISRLPRDSSLSLHGLLGPAVGETRPLTLSLDSPGETSQGVAYYFLTVSEVPLKRPVTPDQAGIQVERWYESFDGGKPTVSVAEGDLVRVRLRITVPTDREFIVLDDALPAGLEAVDLSLRTSAIGAGPGSAERERQRGEDQEMEREGGGENWWYYGWWDGGWWSPFDHRELRDDRVVYFATYLWRGTYTASYIARATTPGVFVRPPAHAEEMYNPAVHGRSDGGLFTVTKKSP